MSISVTYNQAGYTYNQANLPYNGYVDVTITPSTGVATFSAPTATAYTRLTVLVSTINMTVGVNQPYIRIITRPAVLNTTLTIPTVSVSIRTRALPSAITVTSSANNPTIIAIRNLKVTPDIANLLFSHPQETILAIQNLNISIVPDLQVINQNMEEVIFDYDVKAQAILDRIEALAYPSDEVFDTSAWTYNQVGYTYNQVGLAYGGSDRVQFKGQAPEIIQTIQPVFKNY